MLSDSQIETLAGRMGIPLEGVYFKNDLPKDLKFDRSYIINMEDSLNDEGKQNPGSHWCAFQISKTKDGKVLPCYFDPFGLGPPLAVSAAVERFCGKKLPHTSKNIQSLMAECCGYFCLAWLHFINASGFRAGHIYADTETFLDNFEDLNTSIDYKKNEFCLKCFFRADDPTKRTDIDLGDITRF